MPEPVTADIADQATTHLMALQTLLEKGGLHARMLSQPGQLPRLRVINPNCTSLCEVITAAPLGGECSFRWSWAERITLVSDIATAAERISHVLTPAGRPPDHLIPRRTVPTAPAVPDGDGSRHGVVPTRGTPARPVT